MAKKGFFRAYPVLRDWYFDAPETDYDPVKQYCQKCVIEAAITLAHEIKTGKYVKLRNLCAQLETDGVWMMKVPTTNCIFTIETKGHTHTLLKVTPEFVMAFLE